MGRLSSPSRLPRNRPVLGVDTALHGQLELLLAGQGVLGDGLDSVGADGQRLGIAEGLAARLDDGHVVRQEPASPLPQQPQHGAGLAGIGPRGQHHPVPVHLDGGRVEQQAAARDEHEPQQGLDHVGVHDVGGAAEQRGHGDLDPVSLEVEPEVAAELAEVLLVGDEGGTVGHHRPRPQPRLPHRLDPDADVGGGVEGGDPEVLQLAELDLRPDGDEPSDLVEEGQGGRGGQADGRGAPAGPGAGAADQGRRHGGGRRAPLPDQAVADQEPQQEQDNQREEVRNQIIDVKKGREQGQQGDTQQERRVVHGQEPPEPCPKPSSPGIREHPALGPVEVPGRRPLGRHHSPEEIVVAGSGDPQPQDQLVDDDPAGPDGGEPHQQVEPSAPSPGPVRFPRPGPGRRAYRRVLRERGRRTNCPDVPHFGSALLLPHMLIQQRTPPCNVQLDRPGLDAAALPCRPECRKVDDGPCGGSARTLTGPVGRWQTVVRPLQ